MEETQESKTRNTSKYHVIVLGGDTCNTSMGGEVKVFDYKSELSDWLTSNGIREHIDAEVRAQGILQDADGRAVVIIKGHRTTLKTTVSIE